MNYNEDVQTIVQQPSLSPGFGASAVLKKKRKKPLVEHSEKKKTEDTL